MFPESIVERLMWGAGILATMACMAARGHAAPLPAAMHALAHPAVIAMPAGGLEQPSPG